MKQYILFVFVLFISIINAQEMSLGWQSCYGSIGDNTFHALETLPSGDIIATLNVDEDNAAFTNYHGDNDAWVLILDSFGNIISEKCFGGSDEEMFFDIEVSNNCIYFLGYTKSSDGDVQSEPVGGLLSDIWIVKTDYDLNIIWEKRYGNLGRSEPITIKSFPNGDMVFASNIGTEGGGNVSNYYGSQDIWLCKIDENSNILWETTLGNQYRDEVGDLLINEDGNIIVLGETEAALGMVDCNFHVGDMRDFWIVEIDQNGEMLWQECYGGNKHEQGFDIIEDGNGYTILGFTYSNNGDVSGNHGWDTKDIWLFHIDYTGSLIWQKCIGGSERESGYKIFKTHENGYVLIGTSNSDDGDVTANHCWHPGICDLDVWVVITDSNRNILWEYTYGGLQNSYMSRNSAIKLDDMDFLITSTINHDYPEEYGDITADFDCTPYPVEENVSAWIFRLRDCELQLEESIPAKPIGADTICTVHTAQNVYTTQIQYSNYEGIEWQIEPPNAATIIEQDTSLIVNWRPYFEGQVSIKARTTNNCGESDYSDSLLIQVNTCLATQYLQTPKLKTYPNPAQDYIIFEMPIITTKSKLQITDIFGKQITELSIETKQKQLIWDCSAVSGGVYFYQTKLNGEVYRGKLIVN